MKKRWFVYISANNILQYTQVRIFMSYHKRFYYIYECAFSVFFFHTYFCAKYKCPFTIENNGNQEANSQQWVYSMRYTDGSRQLVVVL